MYFSTKCTLNEVALSSFLLYVNETIVLLTEVGVEFLCLT